MKLSVWGSWWCSKTVSFSFANMQSTGGGEIRFTSRVVEDSNRASRHEDADFVEMQWGLFDIDAPAPTTVAELTNTHQSTRAAFKVAFGNENIGKRLYCAFRWGITGSPEKASEWSPIKNFGIGN